MGKIITLMIAFLLVMPIALANHNTYDPFVDLNTINWFDRALYQAAEPGLGCLDLDEFNAYADSDPYDGLDRDDIDLDDIRRLSYGDFLRVADADQYDNIDRDLFNDRADFDCSLLGEYDSFASQDKFDRFERDDYFYLRGFNGERDFQNRARHFPYERRPVWGLSSDPYGRQDGYGGYASWVR